MIESRKTAKTKIAVIGGGPIGCYTAYLLAKNKTDTHFDITIFEEHSKIGMPEQCTGLISKNLAEFVDIASLKKAGCLQNEIKGAVFSCGGKKSEFRADAVQAYVFDRAKFDRLFAKKAIEAGAEILTSHRYIDHFIDHFHLPEKETGKIEKIKIKFLNTNTENSSLPKENFFYSDILIGADGPNSSVAKNAVLFGKRRFYYGNQAILKFKKPFFSREMAYLYFDKKYSDGFFSWLVPIDDETAKVGLASLSSPHEYFQRFLRDEFEKYRFSIESRQGGLIPAYNKQKIHRGSVFLAGDAALMVKATTGGGIINGLHCAKALADAIISGDFDYEKRLKYVRKNLWLHSMIRKKLNKFSDEDYTMLLSKLNKKNVRNMLKEHGDMDFPVKFAFKMLMAEPSLVRYLI